MVIRKFIGSLCLVVSGLFAGAQDSAVTKALNTSEVLTLQQAVDIAIKNNLDVQQSNVAMQRAKVNLNQAKSNMLPSLSADISHGISQGRNINPFTNTYIDQSLNNANYNLSAGLVLFNGFFVQNNIRLNKYAYEASKLEYQQMKDNLTLNVILTYLQILTNEDQLIQAQNQIDVTKHQVERFEVMNKDGAIAPSDLFDLKGQLASDQLSYTNSKNALENSKLTFAQFLNVPYSRDLKIEKLTAEQLPVSYEGDINAIYEKAATQLGMVQAAILRTKSADKAVKTARADMFPILSLGGGYSTNYSSLASTQRFLSSTLDSVGFVRGTGDPVLFKNDQFAADKISYGDQFKNNRGTFVSLGLRIPILNGLTARNRVYAAKLDKKNFELIEENTKIQLKQAIEQAYFNMTAAHDRYDATQKQVDAFKESFRAATVKFNSGAINSVVYLTSKNFLDRANIALIIAKYDYVLRTKILDYYQVKPLW